MIKCGVIGVGYIGKFHAEKFAMLPQASLVGLADINLAAAEKIANQFNTEAFQQYQHLVDKVQAVSIAVPTRKHYEVAKFFLSHGIHVLLEKPMTSTLQEAAELIWIAKENNAILQIGHLERFNAATIALQDVLDHPLFIESERLAPYNPRGGDVNVVLDLMIHDIDLIQYMMQSPITQVDACGAPILSSDIDIANAHIKFKNGCVANVTASRASLRQERRIRIFQHDAYLSIDLQNRKYAIHRKGEKEMFPGIPEITRIEREFTKSDAIKAEIQAFLHAIINSTAPIVSGEDGMQALETAMIITESLTKRLKLMKDNHQHLFMQEASLEPTEVI